LTSDEFKKLRKEWNRRLKESGFDDIENEKGQLNQYNRRTIAFDNRDALFDFYTRLDHFIESTRVFPKYHRKILTLYSKGSSSRQIERVIGKSHTWICWVINQYKKKV